VIPFANHLFIIKLFLFFVNDFYLRGPIYFRGKLIFIILTGMAVKQAQRAGSFLSFMGIGVLI